MKRVLIICGTGIATSTVVASKVRDHLEEVGVQATVDQGKVMDRGLWAWTRHPNYFGDCCVWWGLWLVACASGNVWWTVVGPALMTVLLVRVSGKALLEKDMARRRPEYAAYVERTSGFIPRPPRRG